MDGICPICGAEIGEHVEICARCALKLRLKKAAPVFYFFVGALALIGIFFAPRQAPAWLAGPADLTWLQKSYRGIQRLRSGEIREALLASTGTAKPSPGHVVLLPQSVMARSRRTHKGLERPPEQRKGPALAVKENVPDGRGNWAVEGRIFDLMSLRPIAGGKLFFRDVESDWVYYSETNRKGVYKAVLGDSPEGYVLEIEIPGLRANYLEDWLPSVRTLSKDKRGEFAFDLANNPQKKDIIRGRAGDCQEKNYALVPGVR